METHPRENTISHISSYSLSVFALLLFAAVVLDMMIPLTFVQEPWNMYLGVILLTLGTVIIYWAEDLGRKYSHKRKKGQVTDTDHFSKGLYMYSRNPKYVGMGLLVLALGLILNSLFVAVSSVLSVAIVHYFFIPKEEELMSKRHGSIYEEYKKKVKRWL